MSRRLNRYTGQDEELNRVLRALRRERQRVRCLRLTLLLAVGWVIFLQVPAFPFSWRLAEDRICLIFNLRLETAGLDGE